MSEVKRTEIRRNTLLEYENVKIIVSTVGNYIPKYEKNIEFIGHNRYYETMAFYAKFDRIYWEADIEHRINFDSEWIIRRIDFSSDNEANEMHENVVKEITQRMLKGEFNA